VLVIDDLEELASPDALASSRCCWREGRACCGSCSRRATTRSSGSTAAARRPAHRDPGIRPALHVEETRALLADSGVALPERASRPACAHRRLGRRLRLAALSLAGHPEPERFVVEFSGSDARRRLSPRRSPRASARRGASLLLRTSILERVNGPTRRAPHRGAALKEFCTGSSRRTRSSSRSTRSDHGSGTTRSLPTSCASNCGDPSQRRPPTAPVCRWLVRTTRTSGGRLSARPAAEDWTYAARTLADHSLSLYLRGRVEPRTRLLAAFPTMRRRSGAHAPLRERAAAAGRIGDRWARSRRCRAKRVGVPASGGTPSNPPGSWTFVSRRGAATFESVLAELETLRRLVGTEHRARSRSSVTPRRSC